jgi:hypothetical protein
MLPTTTLRWPLKLTPRGILGAVNPRPIGGGVTSLDGVSQWVVADQGIWKIRYPDLPIRAVDSIVKLYRALAGRLKGPVTPVLLPLFDEQRAPWPTIDGVVVKSYPPIGFGDGEMFDDGTGFEEDVIEATCAAAELRDTELTITVQLGAEFEGGELFSIGDYAYTIIGIDEEGIVTTEDGTTYPVTIDPPLRQDVAADTALNFDHPAVRCILTTEMEVELDRGMRGKATLEFIEALEGT